MRVVIAEDLYLLREGLVHLLTASGITVLAAVDTGEALLTTIDTHHPDLAIVDVRLPPGYTDEGLRAAVEARRRHPGLPILVLSQYVEQIYARELLADGAGGVGYLLKDRVMDDQQFLDAVHRVTAGGTVMDPEVIAKLMRGTTHDNRLTTLTAREREVLGHMAQGHSNTAIAKQLYISEGTLGKHIAAVFTKLGLDTPATEVNRRVTAVLTYLNNQD